MIVFRRFVASASVIALTGSSLWMAGFGRVPTLPVSAAILPSLNCPKQSPYDSQVGTGNAGRRPVILVHGWDGSSSKLDAIAYAISHNSAIKRQVDVKFFDYRDVSEQWASIPAIAGCLGEYITAVSNSYAAAGGNGRVIVIAHSMGGLATMFASSPDYTNDPVGDKIADLISIDTPYLGSPWGGDTLGLPTVAKLAEELYAGHKLDFPVGTDGATCLAEHSPPKNILPSGCHLAPYLPASVTVDELAGNATINRTLFGVHLYDIPLDSDGIVPVASSQGYTWSGPGGKAPSGSRFAAQTVSCTVTYDQIKSAAVAAGIAGAGTFLGVGGVADALAGLAGPFDDSAALDEMLNGRTGPALLQFLVATALAARCSHSGMLTDSAAISDVISDLTTDLQSASIQSSLSAKLFVGTWIVHDGGITIESNGSGSLRFYLGFLSPDATEAANVTESFTYTVSEAGMLTATVTAIRYFTNSMAGVQRTVAGFPELQLHFAVGDHFTLQRIAPGLLISHWTSGSSVQHGGEPFPGNPYFCGAGVSVTNRFKCGA